VLIYETDDSGFADLAVEALKEADIDAYAIGGALPGGSSLTVCIYIRDAADSQKANAILIKLGAVTGGADRLPPKWVLALLAVAAVVLATWAAFAWR
jgi:hypothetical protein